MIEEVEEVQVWQLPYQILRRSLLSSRENKAFSHEHSAEFLVSHEGGTFYMVN